jgi:diguanylate cyclase (GGDEF)-like protein
MKTRISPMMQLTSALVALCGMLVVLADLFFGVMPSRAEQSLQVRKQIGEAVAVQVSTLLRNGDRRLMQQTIDDIAKRTPDLVSAALRRADGSIVAESGGHAEHWQHEAGSASTHESIYVPLEAGGKPWGSFELAFAPEPGGAWMRFFKEPLVLTMLFISGLGTLGFSLYVRRALQHLDPSSVIPDRVQGAFDAMAEGVVVLDARGRVLLASKSFRSLHADAAALSVGAALSAQDWVLNGFGRNTASHPWSRAIDEKQSLSGVSAEVCASGGVPQQVVVNCAPITDAGAKVRGCLVTFSDMSELHRANTSLREAMAELANSKTQIERQNGELHRLATRDPMTGCLNRRAFTEMFRSLFTGAKVSQAYLGCLMIDIDFFKKVNDTHGHSIGDRVIQEVAKKLTDCARASDLVCRYGGEEFVLVVPGLGATALTNFAERVRARIEAECGAGVREIVGMQVTVSVGVSMMQAELGSEQELIDRADQALYVAKRGGRNQVRIWAADAAEATQATQAAESAESAGSTSGAVPAAGG